MAGAQQTQAHGRRGTGRSPYNAAHSHEFIGCRLCNVACDVIKGKPVDDMSIGVQLVAVSLEPVLWGVPAG